MSYNIRGIPPEMIDRLWHFAEPYIKRALDHTFGELSHTDLRGMCFSRDAQLWMIQHENRIVGAGTTTIVVYPQMKACRTITLAGNDFDSWKDQAHATIELWAVENGCDAMEAYVRKGFVPKMLDIGYRHRYSVVHKSLKE